MLCCARPKASFQCEVVLLDGQTIRYSKQNNVKTTTKGLFLFDLVCQHLNVIEKDYFGLKYYDHNSHIHWLDLDKALCDNGTLSKVSSTTPLPTTTTPLPVIGPECSNALTDLAFVMDGSASVGEDGFVLLQDFLMNVVLGFQNVGVNGVQVSLIQYNEDPRQEFNFDQSTNKAVVLDAIEGLSYMGGNTKTGSALQFLLGNFEEARPNSRKVAVIITDGRSQDDVQQPAIDLKDSGVTIFAIGVGEADSVELEEIASHPTSLYVSSVDDFTAIATIQDSLVQKICHVVEGVFRFDGEVVTGAEPDDDGIIFPDSTPGSLPDEEYGTEDGSGELFFDEQP